MHQFQRTGCFVHRGSCSCSSRVDLLQWDATCVGKGRHWCVMACWAVALVCFEWPRAVWRLSIVEVIVNTGDVFCLNILPALLGDLDYVICFAMRIYPVVWRIEDTVWIGDRLEPIRLIIINYHFDLTGALMRFLFLQVNLPVGIYIRNTSCGPQLKAMDVAV